MKKLLSTMFAAVTALTALATNYTGTLTVTINGEPTTQDGVEIIINANDNGNYDLKLNNFILTGENAMPVGNINLEDIQGVTSGNLTALYVDKNVTIENGTDASVPIWYGPMLGPVPLKMLARFTDDFLAVNIDIDMQKVLEQTINVKFDNTNKHFQLPNGDFEEWSSNDEITEPRYWHGFKSATGDLANSATSTLLKSTDVRSGATGSSAVVASKSIFGVVANGTITNGQLMAQSMTAANTWNHSQMEQTSTATDNYGDKFYMPIYAKPDAIKTWIKFTQGSPNAQYPYSTLSAAIFNGEYYQDPEPKVGDSSAFFNGTKYTQADRDAVLARMVAKAQNTSISTTDWSELVVPFDYASYASNNAEAKAILVTVSTNATPGKGSANDQVFIDDMELLYYANVTDIKYQGTTISGFDTNVTSYDMGECEVMPSVNDLAATVEGVSATTAYQVIETEDGYQAIVYVISGDLQTAHAYVLNFTKPVVTTPLAEIIESGENGAEYTIAEDLAVVDIAQLENHAFVTDGNNNWLRVDFSDDIEDFVLMNAIKGGTLKGTLSDVELNPVFTVTEMPQEGENTVDFTVEKINLADEFTLKSNQVVDATGYWQAANSCLRGYSSGGQSLTINSAWATADNTMENGKRYTVRCAISLKEAWKATAGIAPKDYDYDFQNYLGNMLVMPSTPTAIDAINTNTNRQVEAVYNAQGQRVGKYAKGVLIVRYTDGTVAKVVR
ncbi:MAG: calycin-like domain-containing protein [Muribaculaceae bacterium]|nr:calycin-like domain-containing protein [Muribaculaceae bacterium]